MNIKELAYSPCIVYCHGNGGNKIDIIEIFDYLLWEFNIFSFDFSGSGLSEGDYVTLGFYEKDDVKAVVNFLRNDLNISKIILYGRSMGAVSALRYAAEDPNIKAMVLDSPFASFPNLCREILFNKFLIPEMVSNILIEFARDKIKSKIDFDIKTLIPSNNVAKVMVPTIMIHGLQDSLVHFSNSRTIYSNFNKNTYKKLLEVEGEHNDCRSKTDHCIIRDFIIQFAYDMSIINEYRRRMNTLSAQFLFAKRNGIKINKVIKNMKTRFDKKKRKLNNFNIIVKNNNKDSLDKSLSLKEISSMDKKLKKKIRSKSTNLDEELEKIKIYASPCKVIAEINRKRDNSTNCNTVRVQRLNAMLEFDVKKKTKDYVDLDETIYYDSYINLKPIDKILFNDKIVLIKENETENTYTTTHTVPQENNINSENLKILSQNIVNDNKNQLNPQRNIETLQNFNEVDSAISNDMKRLFSSANIPKIKPRLRSERNNVVGGILGSEIRITSDNIKIENLDRSTLRRKFPKD